MGVVVSREGLCIRFHVEYVEHLVGSVLSTVALRQVIRLPIHTKVGLLFVIHVLLENGLPSGLCSEKHVLKTVLGHGFLDLELIWSLHLVLLTDKM